MKGLLILALHICSIFTLTVSVHLNEANLRKIRRYIDTGQLTRVKRQAITDPQPWPGPLGSPRVINVPIPTNIGFFPGAGAGNIDNCPRDMVQMDDGSCQRPLTRGTCELNEEVILDPQTNRGYCAAMLCPVDRIFLPSTQLCHDPRQMDACPSGRELFYTAYGTPVCSCPDGTIEGDDDLDDDVCEVILSKNIQCLYGQVFWFKDFYSPPQCVPDPCSGTNLKRSANELPFVPSGRDGICYQLGKSAGVCPHDQYYALMYSTLKGKCVTLEEAGYIKYNEETLRTINDIYGSPINAEGQLSLYQSGLGNPIGGNHGTQNFGQFGSNIGQHTGGTVISGNLINGGQYNNQINNNAINGNQFNFGTEISNQRFLNDQTIHPLRQNNQTNSFDSGNQANLNIQSGQHNGQSQSVNFGDNNIQYQQSIQLGGQISGTGNQQLHNSFEVPSINNNQQTSQNQYNTQQSFGSEQTHSSHQNIFRQPQLENRFQPSQGINSQQSYSNNQNSNHAASSINDFQQSIEIFSHGSFSSQNQHQNSGQQFTFGGTLANNQNEGYSPGPTGNEPISIEIFGDDQGINSPEVIGAVNQYQSIEIVEENYGSKIGRDLGIEESPVQARLAAHWHIHPNGEVQHRAVRSITDSENAVILRTGKEIVHSRKKRNPLPHASPSNVFETRLLGCKPGAARDINAKCRDTILPARIPKSRGTRAAPPIPPTPTCPQGMAFNIRRMCTASNTAQNSIVAFNLG